MRLHKRRILLPSAGSTRPFCMVMLLIGSCASRLKSICTPMGLLWERSWRMVGSFGSWLPRSVVWNQASSWRICSCRYKTFCKVTQLQAKVYDLQPFSTLNSWSIHAGIGAFHSDLFVTTTWISIRTYWCCRSDRSWGRRCASQAPVSFWRDVLWRSYLPCQLQVCMIEFPS